MSWPVFSFFFIFHFSSETEQGTKTKIGEKEDFYLKKGQISAKYIEGFWREGHFRYPKWVSNLVFLFDDSRDI